MTQTFSSHGASIPALGFGTSPLTGGLAPDSVLAALKAGYRHIDTARKYGTEHVVGEAVRLSGIPRSEIFITTKVSHENLRPTDFARSVEQSLKALQTDYADLLLVHWPNPEIGPEEYMPALAKAKRDGLAAPRLSCRRSATPARFMPPMGSSPKAMSIWMRESSTSP